MVSKYDLIGSNYNRTRQADDYLLHQFKWLMKPQEGGTYLDIGCGTGNYTIGLYEQNHRMIGVDPSIEMLEIAKQANPQITWLLGSAEHIPVKAHTIDGVFGSMTIHHWTSLIDGFTEIERILKGKGSLSLFTSTSEQMETYWLNHYFPRMMEASIKQMPSLSDIEASLIESGFSIREKVPYQVKPDLKDGFLYSGKHHPEVYLDENVRKGISSFASLAFTSEVKSGLRMLKADIEFKVIDSVIASYRSDLGDYLFIHAEKRDEK